MAIKAVNTRGSAKPAADQFLPHPSVARRVAWLVAAGAWLFLSVALLSFNSADAPSHVVAVHNHPAANLCGAVGAIIAYWAYHVIGVGAWMILLGMGIFLGVTVTGRKVNQLMLRSLGLLLMSLAVSCMHSLIAPHVGPLIGSQSGMIGERI